ncbi:DUF1800 domain-containing protein [Martelella alba]|uniref:DUF1800 domain-containing protein n=1 Tax=Martelella alba TaxID=2590451 RepID=A0ABY2SH54_9HYPH|nr:DUF1800 domain-containing protein [Martelella alba]TKI04592.1 DUF1800 domain-containing protein [Martelella alba]
MPVASVSPPLSPPGVFHPLSAAAIAFNRFGLGARPDDTPPDNARAWLSHQFADYQSRPAAWATQPGSLAIAACLAQERRAATMTPGSASGSPGSGARAVNGKQDKAARQAAMKAVNATARDLYQQAVDARVASALTTSAPFIERLVHFWSNHFAVSVDRGEVMPYAGAFEAEAIRPHVLGRFEDMLTAVEQHPAMQLFLDQSHSVGPDSPAALRAEQRKPQRHPGLNENLAREIMELHTLGARSGYSQADVTEFARAMTGWSIGAGRPKNDGPAGGFVFRPLWHEPGAREIMGHRYGQPGMEQARAVLHTLAISPATARHIAGKLARHFIADNPSPTVTEELARAFMQSRGDLPTLYHALIAAKDAWSPSAVKFKSPWDWAISALRALGIVDVTPANGRLPQMAPLLAKLGQPVWRPGSPAGYEDSSANWAAPDALVRRVELAQRLASHIGDRLDPRRLGPHLLAGSLSAATAQAVSRAESVSTGLALLLVSPDFQRR